MSSKPSKLPRKPKVVSIQASKPAPVHPFDLLFNTETGGLIPGAELASGHASDAYITAYYAIAPSILDSLIDLWLRSSPTCPIDHYTFVDVGAGKGRAMLTAAQHPFREVVGIELNPRLAEIARRNAQAFSASPVAGQLAPVSVLEGDALEVPLPDTPVLVMLFHPFEAPLLRSFVTRLQDHFAGRPGLCDLLYVNAEHASVLDRNPAFTSLFNGLVPMSLDDHRADLAEIAEQKEYGSTGDEFCTIYRLG